MEDYKSNSHRSKERAAEANAERKPKPKAVTGAVKVRKKSSTSKFADIFIAEDAANVKSYILLDVLIPAAKKAISDIVTNGIDMLLYGETGHSKRRSSTSTISYNSIYDDRHSRRERSSSRERTTYSYDEIELESRRDAEEVLDKLDETLRAYGMVTVADYYDFVGVSGSYTDNNYGWTSLRGADVVRGRDGYRITLPKAMPIER